MYLHDLFLASDKPGNIIRLLFVDFKKAFDLIDHNVLMSNYVLTIFLITLQFGHLIF
jgi:hypothetical protein